MKNDVYAELCWMLEYPYSERLYKLWKVLLPDEVEAKLLTVFKGEAAPHLSRKTAAEAAAHAGISEEKAEEYLYGLIKKGLVARMSETLWGFGAYGAGCVEDVTDGISYTICSHYYDWETKKLTDPSKQEIIDCLNDFLDHEWYHLQRPDELINARWLLIAGEKPRVVPQLAAIEKSGIKAEDYPDPDEWNIRHRSNQAKSIGVVPCPCRFRNGRIEDFPVYTCCDCDMGDDEEMEWRLKGEYDAGNRLSVTSDEYCDTVIQGEQMGMIHTCMECLCEDSCCNVLNPLKQVATIKEGVQKSPFRAMAKHTDKCNGCGICLMQCRFEAIKIAGGKSVIDPEKCYGCGACVTLCPNDVNELYYVGL